MTKLLFALTLFFSSFLIGQTANAQSFPMGTKQTLEFVSDTTLGDPIEGALTLCVLMTHEHVAHLGWWGTQSYVLSRNRCTGGEHFAYPAVQLIEDRINGDIPANISPEPELSLRFLGNSFSLWLVAGLLVLLILNLLLKSGSSERKRKKLIGDVHPYVHRMVEVMAHAARANGKIETAEVTHILETVQRIGGVTPTIEQVVRVINLTPKIRADKEYKALGRGLDAEGRQKMFNAAVSVIAADGVIDKKERKWLAKLGRGLGYRKAEMMDIFDELNGTPART